MIKQTSNARKDLRRFLTSDPGRFAGGSAVTDPLGLLAAERERLAVLRSPQRDGSPQAAVTANQSTQPGPCGDVTGPTGRDPDGGVTLQIGGSQPCSATEGGRPARARPGPGAASAAAVLGGFLPGFVALVVNSWPNRPWPVGRGLTRAPRPAPGRGPRAGANPPMTRGGRP
jgi:hypothetical protein